MDKDLFWYGVALVGMTICSGIMLAIAADLIAFTVSYLVSIGVM